MFKLKENSLKKCDYIEVDKIKSVVFKDKYGNVLLDLMNGEEYIPFDASIVGMKVEGGINMEGLYINKQIVDDLSKGLEKD